MKYLYVKLLLITGILATTFCMEVTGYINRVEIDENYTEIENKTVIECK
jgi:hypothetical protein